MYIEDKVYSPTRSKLVIKGLESDSQKPNFAYLQFVGQPKVIRSNNSGNKLMKGSSAPVFMYKIHLKGGRADFNSG